MMVYTVTRGSGKNSPELTIHVEGPVTSSNWETLRVFCLDAVKNSNELVLNLEHVSEYDFSLSIFVCLLRRTIMLLDKHLTIQGRLEEFVCLYSNGRHCSVPRAGSCCLCENLFTRSSVS